MVFREAVEKDAAAIAALHAQSWQLHYHNVMKPEYLAGPIIQERLSVWQQRMQTPTPNQYIVLAEEENQLIGFACYYFDKDPKWGTLLDNLHVTFDRKGQGIGKQLVQKGLDWSFEKDKTKPVYLWVYEVNEAAIVAYESMGGRREDRQLLPNPDGGKAWALRYVWEYSFEN